MKVTNIIANVSSISAASIWIFHPTTTTTDIPTTTTSTPDCSCEDYFDSGVTASTTTEELTTTIYPESTASTTTDGVYTPPDFTTTSMSSTTADSTTWSELGVKEGSVITDTTLVTETENHGVLSLLGAAASSTYSALSTFASSVADTTSGAFGYFFGY